MAINPAKIQNIGGGEIYRQDVPAGSAFLKAMGNYMKSKAAMAAAAREAELKEKIALAPYNFQAQQGIYASENALREAQTAKARMEADYWSGLASDNQGGATPERASGFEQVKDFAMNYNPIALAGKGIRGVARGAQRVFSDKGEHATSQFLQGRGREEKKNLLDVLTDKQDVHYEVARQQLMQKGINVDLVISLLQKELEG